MINLTLLNGRSILINPSAIAAVYSYGDFNGMEEEDCTYVALISRNCYRVMESVDTVLQMIKVDKK